ncbi:MAG: alpha/beta hydrolase [Oscillospiraceae bacterium]|jgi:alpha-beta hydrolase superfamily lysophospholipase|nr:alpha/beta hydrolase [Oscillospiraceae bacterium]
MSLSIVTLNNPWVIAAIALLAAGAVVMFIATPIAIFCNTMYRNPKKKRTRECTNTKDEQQMRMFEEGIIWANQYKDKTERLHIVNDGLNLYGEYINFGFDKCAVILQGRTESLLYSYYFADVYAKNGFNILVVDVRAHGLSDGKYQTAGIKESDDLVLWIKLINENYAVTDFTIHGVCVGGATAVYTYVKLKNDGVNLIKSIVTDGLFQSWREIFKQNFKMRNKPVFPILQLTFFIAFVLAKVRLFEETPQKYMRYIDIPIMFIWSSKDIFCGKSKCEELFEACASKNKELCFFPEGRHSHVRSTQEAEYDKVIAKFLQKINNKQEAI